MIRVGLAFESLKNHLLKMTIHSKIRLFRYDKWYFNIIQKGKVTIGKVFAKYCMFLYLDVQFISFPTTLSNKFITNEEYSLIGKII